MRRIALPTALAAAAVHLREARPTALSGPTMGVRWSLRCLAPEGLADAEITAAVQGAANRVVAQMSPWEPHSDISRFNGALAGAWVAAPAEFRAVLAAALDWAARTGGAFDPTVGEVVDLWGFGPPGAVAAPPSNPALARARIDWRAIEIDQTGGRLRQPGGLRLDLSGIAKGFGVDLAAQALEALAVKDFLIEIGGELRGAGVKENGEPWWVEIERPSDAALPEPSILVGLHGLSIATSGDWRRTFSAGGRRYGHVIDPHARAPTDGAIASVSVLHAECMHADALCTALMALGPDAQAFAQENDVAACFLMRGAEGPYEVVSPALQRLLD